MMSRIGRTMTETTRSTGAEPYLAVSAPITGIMVTEPIPKARINRPMTVSPISSRFIRSGILGAQFPIRKPLTRNRTETATRSVLRPKGRRADMADGAVPDMGGRLKGIGKIGQDKQRPNVLSKRDRAYMET